MKKSILIIAAMAFAISASAQIGTSLINQAKEVVNAKTGTTQVKIDSAVSKTSKVTDTYLPGAAANVKANVKAAIDQKTQAVADLIDGKPTEKAPAEVTPAATTVQPTKPVATTSKTKATTKKKKTKK